MIDERRLSKEQPIVYQILKNGLLNNKVAHAYLFIGAKGTPKLETAYLLAKSILCEDGDGFACGNCSICHRIEQQNYTDLIVLDGSETSIKKEQILKLQEQFNKTGLETYGKKIYILNDVENTSPEALNSLLKFLEEPTGDQIYAILITSKVDRLLDTIISRCQNITFRPIDEETCAQESIAVGVEQEDAYILSKLVKDPVKINEITLDETYHKTKTYFFEIMEAFINDGYEATFTAQRIIKDDKKFEKEQMQLIIDIMIVFFKECLSITFTSSQPKWNELVAKANRMSNIPVVLTVLLETQDAFQRYPNMNLLIDQMFYRMTKGVL